MFIFSENLRLTFSLKPKPPSTQAERRLCATTSIKFKLFRCGRHDQPNNHLNAHTPKTTTNKYKRCLAVHTPHHALQLHSPTHVHMPHASGYCRCRPSNRHLQFRCLSALSCCLPKSAKPSWHSSGFA